jgi:hypothetical protein
MRSALFLEVRMSSKGSQNGQKKKLTKKELKAQNHAKLMANKGSGQPATSNVVDINAFRGDQKDKKAA